MGNSVFLAVYDEKYCYTLLDIGDTGRYSDGGVLTISNFGNAIPLSSPESSPVRTSLVSYFLLGILHFPLDVVDLSRKVCKQFFNYHLFRVD